MHILIIPSEEYIPPHNPIAGIFQHDQAKILKEKGNKVGALSFTFRYSFFSLVKASFGIKTKYTSHLNFFSSVATLLKKSFSPKCSSLTIEKIDGVNVVRCDGFWSFKNTSDENRYSLWIKYGKYAIDQYIEKFGKPDIMHAHNMIYAGLLASSLKNKYNIPIVITEHSSQYAMNEISTILTDKLKEAYKKEQNVFAVSPKLIKLLSSIFNIPSNLIKWLPNVLDPIIEAKVFNPKKPQQTVRFLNVANLIPLKGQEELIKAFAATFSETDNVELVIAGEGYLKEHLNELILQLNLNNKVKLLGYIDRNEVIEQMDRSSVFVLPSHYETFGVVLIEALSRGVPVISTNCGGPECIVNQNNGILVQPKNVTELSEALSKMYHNYQSYNARLLREQLINTYGKEAFYQKIISIYKKTISS